MGKTIPKLPPDFKKSVVDKINRKRIKIRSPFVFLAEKIGLESVLAATIIFGAIIVSIFLLFLERSKIHKFIQFGWPGIKVFFYALPYDYIALFILAIALAFYLTRKIMFIYCKFNVSCNKLGISFILATILLGLLMVAIGLDHVFGGWSKNKIPEDVAISGKIINLDFSKNEVVLLDNSNNMVKLLISPDTKLTSENKLIKGKYIQAVGRRDQEGDNYHFHAYQVSCCDENYP